MPKTEMHTRDIPALYHRFEREVGAKHWRNRVAQCKAEIKGNEFLGNYLRGENSIAFQLDHLGNLVERHGLAVPIQMIENPAIYPAVTFAAQVVSLMDASPRHDADRLVRRVHGAFRNPDDTRGLCLELQTATHFIQLGMRISWPETNGTGTFDLLVEGIGLNGLEVECKSISTDKGRRIHTREAIEFHSILMPHVDPLTASLASGLSVVLTLPGRLPKAPDERTALALEVARAIYSGVKDASMASGPSIRIRHFDAIALNDAYKRGDRRAFRRMLDEVSGTRNRESMVMGSLAGGALVFTIQSAQDDDWKKATFDTLSDAAKRQLTGTRGGLLLASLDGLDSEQLRSIGLQDQAPGNTPSKLQDGVDTFLSSTRRDHVVGVGFVSRSRVVSERIGIIRTGGTAYYFRKKQSPFWSEDFRGLYSWVDE
jgi:hypothetical protein